VLETDEQVESEVTLKKKCCRVNEPLSKVLCDAEIYMYSKTMRTRLFQDLNVP